MSGSKREFERGTNNVLQLLPRHVTRAVEVVVLHHLGRPRMCSATGVPPQVFESGDLEQHAADLVSSFRAVDEEQYGIVGELGSQNLVLISRIFEIHVDREVLVAEVCLVVIARETALPWCEGDTERGGRGLLQLVSGHPACSI